MFDVTIIGAGPCGTAAAYELLSAGLSVLLVDKVDFPRKKACAGGITPKAYQLFRYDISPVIKRVCHRVNVRGRDKKVFQIKNTAPLCYMTRRSELDAFSLAQVIRSGAVFHVIPKIHAIKETARGVQIHTTHGRFTSRFLIGADGAGSRVRRLTATRRFWQYQPALEADVHVRTPSRYEMEFDFSNRHKGYFWIFPKDDHVNIGIYALGNRYRLMKGQLLQYASQRFGVEEIHAVKGYSICTGGFSYQPRAGRILLAGDAAGFAEKLLGEGIYFALKSGQAAARAVIRAINSGASSAASDYCSQLFGLRTDLRLHQMSAHILYSLPSISLKLLSVPAFHRPFSKGYAAGSTLSQILFGR